MLGKGKGKARAQDKGKGKAKVPAQDKGKRKAKVPLTVDRLLNMTAAAVRQKHSRDTAKQLDATNEQLIQVMRKQVELLEEELLRRKQETDPYYLALVLAKAEILEFEEQHRELQSMYENREKLKGWLAAWVDTYMVHKPPQGSPNYMEVTLLQDDYGRRRGCVYMTNRTHIMSQHAYPYKPFGNSVQDKVDVKVHLGEDEHGVCIKAFESYVNFTVEGNYENVAKTWRFDYTESTPAFTVLLTEEMEDNILYVIQAHNTLKLKRISVSGVFPGYPGQDRITVTHAGIAVDERYPFAEGESRSSGFQWTIFEHVTDRLTLVRWSSLAFCAVNAHGSLSLHDTARSFGFSVNQFDSDEIVIERIRHIATVSFERIIDHFRHRFDRFKLEAPIMGSRDQLFEEEK